MTFIPVPNTVKVVWRYLNNTVDMVNVTHFRKATPGVDVSTMAPLASELLALWQDEIQPLQCSACQFMGLTLTDLTSQDGAFYELNPTSATYGTADDASLPGNATVAVRLRTAKRGRAYQGRLYQIGMTDLQCDGNRCSTAFQAALQPAWDAFRSPGIAGWIWSVVSYTLNGVARTEGVATEITSVSVNREMDSQRRRLIN